MTYPCLLGGCIIGNNVKNHWEQYLSKKTTQICGKSGLIDFIKDMKLINFAVWQIKDKGYKGICFEDKTYQCDNFCI